MSESTQPAIEREKVVVMTPVVNQLAPEASSSLFRPNLKRRQLKAQLFRWVITMATIVALLVLVALLARILQQGMHWLSWDFFNNFPSRFPARSGIKSALYGSAWLTGLTLVFSVVFGVGAAVYLEELAGKNKFSRIIEVNIATLAGVPSIIYGILGLAVFVRFFDLGRSVMAGALTMSLLTMPVIIIASREAIKSVPTSIRLGAYALGATKWQTVRDHVLPAAAPGILTGVILSMARAVGEAAPLIMIGALTFVAFVPEGPMDEFTALPIQIFNWASRPQEAFHELAAAGILVLLGFLLICNSIAIVLRYVWRGQRG